MGLHSKYQVALVCVFLLPALCLSKFTNSKATFYTVPGGGGTPTGACGFDDYGSTENKGWVTDVSDKLWRSGAGCGACYQVKCKNTTLCRTNGVTVPVTNQGGGGGIDFVMSLNGFLQLGKNANASEQLKKKGIVDVKYQRVSCAFDGSTVKIKINKNSRFPSYLAIAVIYIPGTRDVVAFEISRNGGGTWIPLKRAFGGVFHLPNAPSGPFKVRIRFSGSTNWKVSPGIVIPAPWKVGAIYNTGIKAISLSSTDDPAIATI